MRAFFSIPICDALRQPISDVARNLRSETTMRARWVAQENYHITLRFLGDIDPSIVRKLESACASIAARINPFTCTLDRVGAFPSADRARVIWIGGEAPAKFRDLSQALASELRKQGFPGEKSESLVHVTLARIKDHPDPALGRLISTFNPIEPLMMTIREILLMESVLTRQGAIYTPVFAVALRETGAGS